MAKKDYVGKMLRVDLSSGEINHEMIDSDTMRKYVGGSGLGAKILYDEVQPGVEWSDPDNRFIITAGPLAGTRMMGSGTFCIATKGPLTNGAATSQANGYLGAYIRFNGYDGIVMEGASDRLVYLYLKDGKAELKDASHLAGKDTWEVEDLIKSELDKTEKELSVYSIGPAGENLVKFAGFAGDKGHMAGHNGTGAVMGSKRLKAVAVDRSSRKRDLYSPETFSTLAEEIGNENLENPRGKGFFKYGTGMAFGLMVKIGNLPVKNYTTSLFPEYGPFMAKSYRQRYQIKRSPCWACRSNHLHILAIPDGPYEGFVGEEPEYEMWAAWGPLIGNKDIDAAVVISNEVDRLGLEGNEAGYLISWVIECFERGLITEKETDGLKMTWGNVEAVRAMLRKVANRDGFGDLLAEGVMRASQKIGGEAADCAVYAMKGNAPRGHDHRARWFEMLDTTTSNTGTIETTPFHPFVEGMAYNESEPYSGEVVSTNLATAKAVAPFKDCLGVCFFCMCVDLGKIVTALNAATGWDMDVNEALDVGLRQVNVLRAFNIRHGITPDKEKPSKRYGSVPVDGPAKGKDIAPEWDKMMDNYYKLMGWDIKTGKPLPETLDRYGLEKQVKDLWG